MHNVCKFYIYKIINQLLFCKRGATLATCQGVLMRPGIYVEKCRDRKQNVFFQKYPDTHTLIHIHTHTHI